jgi:hypothetical protein
MNALLAKGYSMSSRPSSQCAAATAVHANVSQAAINGQPTDASSDPLRIHFFHAVIRRPPPRLWIISATASAPHAFTNFETSRRR